MINVSANFITLSTSDERNIEFRILINKGELTFIQDWEISDVEIEQIGSNGGIGIGNAISWRLSFKMQSSFEWGEDFVFTPQIRFLGATDSEWLSFGDFEGNDTSSNKSTLSVTAYDALYNTDIPCTWEGRSAINPLTFPASMQDMLNYVCAILRISNGFTCENFTVTEKPEDYTCREILRYISASHAGNCYIDNTGKLNIKRFENTNVEILKANIIEMDINKKSTFKVNGIAFHRGEYIIFIDGDEHEYSDDRPGIIHCDNPLVTIEIAEYVWNKLGSMEYHNCQIEKQGFGYLQCGDMCSIVPVNSDNNQPLNIVITSLKYVLNAETGFTEMLISEAFNERQSANRNSKPSVSTPFWNEGNGTGSGNVINKPIIITVNLARHMLNNYYTVKLAPPDRIIFGNISNQIICQGYIFHRRYVTNLDINTQIYNKISLRAERVVDDVKETKILQREITLIRVDEIYNPTRYTFNDGDGRNSITTIRPNMVGFALVRANIYGPSKDFPNGALQAFSSGSLHDTSVNMMHTGTSDVIPNTYIRVTMNGLLLDGGWVFPFDSIEEYNAAINLTQEPAPLGLMQVVQESRIVLDTPPFISALNNPEILNAGQYYNIELEVLGTPRIECYWDIDSGGRLPEGMEITLDGRIIGTPTITGNYRFIVSAVNIYGTYAREINIRVIS